MFEILTTRNCESAKKLPNAKFAMLFLQNCDLWSVFNKHQNFEFFKKTRKLCIIEKKKSHESKHFFHILHLSSKFHSFRFNNKENSKTESVPLIDNTNELIRKILSEQLHNQIIYATSYFHFKVTQNLVAEHYEI